MPLLIATLRTTFRTALAALYAEREADTLFNRALEFAARITPMQRLALQTLPDSLADALRTIAVRLAAHEPLEYITGTALFCGLPIAVSPAVLIPRPETEELVALALAAMATLQRPNVIDLCTGSGCIAHAIKHVRRDACLTGVDISADALVMAHANSLRNRTGICLLRADVLQGRLHGIAPQSQHILTANPPYVMQADAAQMQQNVLAHEPHLALFAPPRKPLGFF